jgi:hypothetical protein
MLSWRPWRLGGNLFFRPPIQNRLRSIIADPHDDSHAFMQFAGSALNLFPIFGFEALSAQQKPRFDLFRSSPFQSETLGRFLIRANAERELLWATLVFEDSPLKRSQMVAGAFERGRWDRPLRHGKTAAQSPQGNTQHEKRFATFCQHRHIISQQVMRAVCPGPTGTQSTASRLQVFPQRERNRLPEQSQKRTWVSP